MYKAILVDPAAKTGRKARKPQHTFQVQHKPFVIVPTMIAPVLPGETLKNALMQARAIGPNMKNQVLGAWLEHHLFYVKLRDLSGWNVANGYRAMLMDQSINVATQGTADQATYRYAGAVDYVRQALTAVVDEFFRDEDEVWNTAGTTLGGEPMAQIIHGSVLDSALPLSKVGTPDAGDYLPGDKPENEDLSLSPDFDPHYAAWFAMFSKGYIDLDYDDYLKAYGIKSPEIEREEESSKPEHLRAHREWTYPSNTVDGTGNVSTVHSWSPQIRADKARYFKEPGFIFAVTLMRPKVYLSKLGGAAVGMMSNALQWLPKALLQDEFTALKQFAAGAGPAAAQTEGYWLDIRDLFEYGDQLTNCNLSATDAGLVALPTPAMQRRYVAQADIDAMVKTVGQDLCRQDGVWNLTILGHVKDSAPGR